MSKVLVINGSPRMENGNTAMMQEPFINGMREAGARVKVLYASKMQIEPCSCGSMYCWYTAPGTCCLDDNMQMYYKDLKDADILVIATPVYAPLPGALQDLFNRLMPLTDPVLEFKNGRTRARMRSDVALKKVVLLATTGWWEKANAGIVERIIKEMCQNSGLEYAGALVRPHVDVMKVGGKLNLRAKKVLKAAFEAGVELIAEGRIEKETFKAFSRPLIRREAFITMMNKM